jgi:predicted flap endonuclease-1-like 5' DNA nuclease
MFSKLLVFGAGYVLGTKAGRARYNQIAAIAQAAARQLDGYAARNAVSARDSWSASRTGASRSGYSRF